jgi:hypothetical protein
VRLAFSDALIVTNHFDPEMAALADRHYSRRTVGARQFLYSGKKIVIRDALGLVLFGWIFPDETMRMDGQKGYNCAIFRNESPRQSSEIILESEQIAFDRWGPNRMYTYVDPAKILSVNPGYCFKQAGWTTVHRADGSVHTSKAGQHLLQKPPARAAHSKTPEGRT